MTTRVNLSGIDGNTGTLAESLTINAISHSTDISITSNGHVGLFVESANGNVGIGTTSPGSALDVTGTATLDRLVAIDTTGTNYSIIENRGAGASKDTLVLRNYGSGSNDTGQGVKLIFAPTINDVTTRHAAIESIQNGSNAIDMRFYTSQGSDPVERARITSAGLVGIGESSPGRALHITNAVPMIKLEDASGNYNEIGGSSGQLEIRADHGNTNGSSYIKMQVDGGERLKIEAGAIKTSSVSQIAMQPTNVTGLTINYQLALPYGTTVGNATHYWLIASASQREVRAIGRFYGIRTTGVGAVGAGTIDLMYFTHNSGSEYYGTIESKGLMGNYGFSKIDLVTLTYNSTSYVAIRMEPSSAWNTDYDNFVFQGILSNTNGNIINSVDDTITNVAEFSSSAGDSVKQFMNTKVGIGTTTPLSSLHIDAANGAENFIRLHDGNSSYGYALGLGTNGDYIISKYDGGSAVEALRVARTNGNITIPGDVKTNNLSNRNVLINGNFNIAQRGTSATYTGGIWKYLSPDRWMGHFDGGPTGATHHVFSGGPNNGSSQFAEVRGPTSGGNGNGYFGQRIEAKNLLDIRAANTMTFSGWIRREGSSTAATTSINFITPTAVDNYASYNTIGASWTSSTISGNGSSSTSGLTLTSVNTWYYFTITRTNVSGITDIANGLQLYFAFGGVDGTDDKFQYAQLQLEAGTVATPFEYIDYSTELSRCQRYFYQTGSSTSSGNAPFIGTAMTASGSELHVNTPFLTEMRTVPSWSVENSISNFEFRRDDNTQITLNYGSTSTSNLTRTSGAMWFGGMSSMSQSKSGFIRVRSGLTDNWRFDAEL